MLTRSGLDGPVPIARPYDPPVRRPGGGAAGSVAIEQSDVQPDGLGEIERLLRRV